MFKCIITTPCYNIHKEDKAICDKSNIKIMYENQKERKFYI
jgi:hypothetical protein